MQVYNSLERCGFGAGIICRKCGWILPLLVNLQLLAASSDIFASSATSARCYMGPDSRGLSGCPVNTALRVTAGTGQARTASPLVEQCVKSLELLFIHVKYATITQWSEKWTALLYECRRYVGTNVFLPCGRRSLAAARGFWLEICK